MKKFHKNRTAQPAVKVDIDVVSREIRPVGVKYYLKYYWNDDLYGPCVLMRNHLMH